MKLIVRAFCGKLVFFSISLGLWGLSVASADVTAPAVFTVHPVVAATNPGAWTATTGGGTVNEVNYGGGFEPLCFKWRWQAVGDAADEVPLQAWDLDGWDTYNEGFFNGSTVRVYRARNDRLVKVREDRVAAHRVKRWMGALDGLLAAETTSCQFTFAPWNSPVQTYYFAVVALDHNGNRSPLSNVVSTSRNTATGAEPVNATHTFTAPPTPSETVPPAAPGDLALSLNEATGLFTFSWTGVTDSDLEGYELLLSYWPPEEIGTTGLELEGRASDPSQYIRQGDLIYLDRTRTEWDPRELISPRLYGDYASGMPSYWPWDITRLEPRRVQHLVPHPTPIPAEFTSSERGQTCLHVSTTIPGDEVLMRQFNHAGTSQTWYPVLEVGATYVVEAWMRQEGITGGQVTFRLGGDYGAQTWDDPDDAYVPWIDFTVTGEWVKYTATFTIPGPYDEDGVGSTELLFTGPGQLWLDNFRVYKEGTAFMDWPTVDYEALAASKLGAIRTHQFIKSGWSYTMDELTNPAGVTGSRGNNSSGGHTLPHILGILERAGVNPWLQIESSQSETEWLGLVEFLAAPYDPAVDTPESKPWAAKRHAQGRSEPWVDAFDKIYFEISNEMWNTLAGFTPWSVNGVSMPDASNGKTHAAPAVQGMLQEYILSVMRTSPWWSQLVPKWEVVVGGWNGNTGEDDWGFGAAKMCPDIRHVTWANYNGGWDEGALPLNANDEGRFLTLTVVPQSMDASNRAFAETRDAMAAKGFHFDIGTYEAGPGYSLNGLNGASVTDAQQEAESQVMKGLPGGTGTLDAFLNGALYGMKLQNFFTFERGRLHWRSHARYESGLQPYPAWLGMEMYNGHAQGDFLIVMANSMPTADLAPTLTRPEMANAPMAACYATRDGDRYAVFVLSRLLDNYPVADDDGHIPVTLRLPFTSCTGIRLLRMQGDPRVHNLDSYEIQLEEVTVPIENFAPEFSLDASRGATDLGLPPAASYLYIFEGVSGEPAFPEPQPTISLAAGVENPTLSLPITFDVVFSEPVEGFDAGDVSFTGTAPVLDYAVNRAPIGAGAVYQISVNSLANSGTLTPLIAAQRCLGVETGQGNLPSVFSGALVAYDLPPEGGIALNDAIADVETGMDAGDSASFRGDLPQLYIYGDPFAGWAHNAFMSFPVVNCLDRTITAASLQVYKMGDGTPTLGIWAVDNDTWEEATLNGTSLPIWGAQLTSLTLPATEGYVAFDLTEYVRAETVKDATVSLLIGELNSGTGSYSLISREGPGQGWPPLPDGPPLLAITWSASNGLPNCATPIADHPGGISLQPQTVALTSATPGSTIRYTLDGTVPSASHGTVYLGPVTVSTSATLRAIALADAHNPSGVRNLRFEIFSAQTLPVVATPAAGTFLGPLDLILASATPGASIRFTLDGSTPSRTGGFLYKGPINIAATNTLRAVAFVEGQSPSAVTEERYIVVPDRFIDRIQSPSGGTLTASGQAGEYSAPGNLIDGEYWTPWEISDNEGWVQFQFPGGESRTISRYAFGSSAGNPGSAASNWTLAGSPDGVEWTTLDTRTGVVYYTSGTNHYYDITDPASYAFYRLSFTNFDGGDYTTMGGFQLLEFNTAAPDFEVWREERFTPAEITAGLAEDGRDDDRDGLPLLFEYAYDADPRLAQWLGPVVALASGEHRLELPFAARNDLDLALMLSSDLSHWETVATSLGGAPFSYTAAVHSINTDNDGWIVFTLAPAASPDSSFYRLRVTRRQ